MAQLNITYNGLSADVPVAMEFEMADADVRRIAIELIRSGGVPGIHLPDLGETAFDNFMVDRFDTAGGGKRLYLRPQVPFGGAS